MAKPIVRLLLPCRSAATDPGDLTWVLRSPLFTVTPPSEGLFPFRQRALWVYAQLSGGFGRWEIAVEFGQRSDSGAFRAIGVGLSVIRSFAPATRLAVWELGFPFRRVPFAREGLYEFRLVGRSVDAGGRQEFEILEGLRPGEPAVAEVRALKLES